MIGPADETVGANFSVDRLRMARDATLAVIEAAAAEVRPGVLERDAKTRIVEIQMLMGAPKSWHPPQIRFGKNTLLSFGKPGDPDTRLADDDIFFFDIGPIFDGYEGDVGRTFAVGDDIEMKRCCTDIKTLWFATRDHWKEFGATGPALYEFAEAKAESMGWTLALEKANGHRIADFPHAAKARGSIEGFAQTPAPDRWILEIQIRHPTREFGAFYEDILS